VNGITSKITRDMLFDHFCQYGEIRSIKSLFDPIKESVRRYESEER
jgi:hypothetical protein